MAKKLHLKSAFISFLKLIRFSNLLILAITQYMVAIFLIVGKQDWLLVILDWRFFCLVLSTCLIAAAGYIINDYYDIKIDIINKPKRVIIGKAFRRRLAITSHTILNFLGIFIALFAGWLISTLSFMSAFFLWLYSNSLKRLPLVGNLMVAFLTALSILLVGIYYRKNLDLVIIYALFAFFISIVREVIKDMEDVKGDAAFGCKTLPIEIGIRKTKIFLYLWLTLFLLSLSLLGYKLNHQLGLYFLVIIVPSTIFLVTKLVKSDNSRDFSFLSKLCKIIMVVGVISMLFI